MLNAPAGTAAIAPGVNTISPNTFITVQPRSLSTIRRILVGSAAKAMRSFLEGKLDRVICKLLVSQFVAGTLSSTPIPGVTCHIAASSPRSGRGRGVYQTRRCRTGLSLSVVAPRSDAHGRQPSNSIREHSLRHGRAPGTEKRTQPLEIRPGRTRTTASVKVTTMRSRGREPSTGCDVRPPKGRPRRRAQSSGSNRPLRDASCSASRCASAARSLASNAIRSAGSESSNAKPQLISKIVRNICPLIR